MSKSNWDGNVNSPEEITLASIRSDISIARSVAVISILSSPVFNFIFERIGMVFLFSTTL